MIQAVVENLNITANFIYIVQQEHFLQYNLGYLLNLITPGCKIVQINGLTEGAASTTLLAKNLIDSSKPLLIANSDQIVIWNSSETIYGFDKENADGGIVTFESTHPKWSYVKLNEQGLVSEVAEKKPISKIATVGIYYWRKGSDYVKYAEQMIKNEIRTNGEFYVAPVFNEAIKDQKKFKISNISKMWGIGTPEDLDIYLNRAKFDQ
jgi:dTDP-glucose pyrophosphorylase